jgi:hypothetical protein
VVHYEEAGGSFSLKVGWLHTVRWAAERRGPFNRVSLLRWPIQARFWLEWGRDTLRAIQAPAPPSHAPCRNCVFDPGFCRATRFSRHNLKDPSQLSPAGTAESSPGRKSGVSRPEKSFLSAEGRCRSAPRRQFTHTQQVHASPLPTCGQTPSSVQAERSSAACSVPMERRRPPQVPHVRFASCAKLTWDLTARIPFWITPSCAQASTSLHRDLAISLLMDHAPQ